MTMQVGGTTGVTFPDTLTQAAAVVMTGAVNFFAQSTPPVGWLKANGAAVSRTTYATLFAAIGTTYGSGDGSTTFNLPDMRGYFARGWVDNGTVDSGRALGSTQTDELKSHSHPTNFNSSYAYGPTYGPGTTLPQATYPGSTGSALTNTAAGGTETRPVNVALLACIKF